MNQTPALNRSDYPDISAKLSTEVRFAREIYVALDEKEHRLSGENYARVPTGQTGGMKGTTVNHRR